MSTYCKNFFSGMKLLLFSFCLILISQPAICDDALMKVYGGGLKMLDGEATSLRMESETVKIELHKKTYTVDATFDFFNYGDTITSLVGFPKSAYGYSGPFKGVLSLNKFQTWVNGKTVKIKEMPGEVTLKGQKIDHDQQVKLKKGIENGWGEETLWLVKKVTFKGNAKTVTRIKYTVPYGTVGEGYYGEYLYGTGKSWKGTIGKAQFIIKASPGISLYANVAFTEGGYFQNKRQYLYKRIGEYEYEYILEDFEPKENENLKFHISLKSDDQWELSPSDKEDKIISRDKLELLSLWELKIFKNARYAYHGKIFIDPELNSFFKKFDWYKPKADFKESDLTESEQANVKAIKAYENELRSMSHRK